MPGASEMLSGHLKVDGWVDEWIDGWMSWWKDGQVDG